MGVWPQFTSPLPWDVAAVITYFTVSLLFWYLGPDPRPGRCARLAPTGRCAAAHLRPLRPRLARLGAALAPLPHRLRCCSPGLATPLVLSVHSIVSMDFAIAQAARAGTRPIFPPYFVAGAIFSRLRHGAHARSSRSARRLRPRERHHRAPPRHCGQADAGHRAAGHLQLHLRDFIAWYSGDRLRALTSTSSRGLLGTVRLRLLVHDRSATWSCRSCSGSGRMRREPARALHRLAAHPGRDVDGALRDHRHLAGSRTSCLRAGTSTSRARPTRPSSSARSASSFSCAS